MTGSKRVVAALSGLALVLAAQGTARAWEAPFMEEAIKKAIKIAKDQQKDEKQLLPKDGVCLVGGFVEKKGILTWKTKLKKGVEYFFIAAGDRDVKEMKLDCVEGKNEPFTSDTHETPWAWVTPEYDFEVELKLRVLDAPDDVANFCVIVMLQDGGKRGSLDRLELASKIITEACTKVNESNDFEFAKEKNSACLVASLMVKENWREVTRFFDANETYLIVAGGDPNCTDIDIQVRDGDREVAKDDSTDPSAAVVLQPTEKRWKGTIRYTMADTKPKTNAFGVVAVLQKKH